MSLIFDTIIDSITDPENQPHQWIGDPKGLKRDLNKIGFTMRCVDCDCEVEISRVRCNKCSISDKSYNT